MAILTKSLAKGWAAHFSRAGLFYNYSLITTRLSGVKFSHSITFGPRSPDNDWGTAQKTC